MDVIIYEYENTLIGRIKGIGAHNFYNDEPGGSNEQKALSCIRYCIEYVLGWDMEDTKEKFDNYIIETMKLSRLLAYIRWPAEVTYGNPKYILSLLYPTKIRYKRYEMIEEIYQNVLDETRQFPREYFVGSDGFYRFSVCLKYLFENYKTFRSCDELYRFILSPEGNRFLCEFKLRTPADQFDINIIDCIHYITSNDPASELYYCYYSFESQFKKEMIHDQTIVSRENC